ncbi:MAG: glycerate kinase [Opitutaceae bacterium]|nr:glycerate kinase [Opitutaceae bacterium]
MRVLLAFDKFKDSLTAPRACAAAAAVLRERHPTWTIEECPLADGGEGFAPILTQTAGGTLHTATVTGPRGEAIAARFGLVPFARIPAPARALLQIENREPQTGSSHDFLALVEMAAASGLDLLPPEQRDPWQTTTLGTGELLRAAAARGAAAILLGVGGSATNDLGLGALNALSLVFLDASGGEIHPPIPAHWAQIHRLAGQVPAGLPPIRIACDVTNPLLGPAGAAAVYGPQKGLRAADLPRIENESARLALLLCTHLRQPDTLMDTPGAGAAGGIAFGLMAGAGARLLPGLDLVAAWLDLDRRIAAADLVITGEGRFDESSLSGKGPGALALRALQLGKPVHVFAGQISPPAAPPKDLHLHAITPRGMPLAEALRTAPVLLKAAVAATFSPR